MGRIWETEAHGEVTCQPGLLWLWAQTRGFKSQVGHSLAACFPSRPRVSPQAYGEGTHFPEPHDSLSPSTFLGPGLTGECATRSPPPVLECGPRVWPAHSRHRAAGGSPGAEDAGGYGPVPTGEWAWGSWQLTEVVPPRWDPGGYCPLGVPTVGLGCSQKPAVLAPGTPGAWVDGWPCTSPRQGAQRLWREWGAASEDTLCGGSLPVSQTGRVEAGPARGLGWPVHLPGPRFPSACSFLPLLPDVGSFPRPGLVTRAQSPAVSQAQHVAPRLPWASCCRCQPGPGSAVRPRSSHPDVRAQRTALGPFSGPPGLVATPLQPRPASQEAPVWCLLYAGPGPQPAPVAGELRVWEGSRLPGPSPEPWPCCPADPGGTGARAPPFTPGTGTDPLWPLGSWGGGTGDIARGASPQQHLLQELG